MYRQRGDDRGRVITHSGKTPSTSTAVYVNHLLSLTPLSAVDVNLNLSHSGTKPPPSALLY